MYVCGSFPLLFLVPHAFSCLFIFSLSLILFLVCRHLHSLSFPSYIILFFHILHCYSVFTFLRHSRSFFVSARLSASRSSPQFPLPLPPCPPLITQGPSLLPVTPGKDNALRIQEGTSQAALISSLPYSYLLPFSLFLLPSLPLLASSSFPSSHPHSLSSFCYLSCFSIPILSVSLLPPLFPPSPLFIPSPFLHSLPPPSRTAVPSSTSPNV